MEPIPGTKHSGRIVWSATPTPFLEDGSLDLRGVHRLVEHHGMMGVSGLFLGGTCGEGGFMPDHQRTQLVRRVKEAAGDSFHIAAHVSDTSAARVSENVRRMTGAGADSVVIAPPYVVGDFCNRDFLRRYFLEPLETAGIPAGIYLRRPSAAMPLDAGLWSEVIAHPRVKYVKDSSSMVDIRTQLVRIKRQRPELVCLTGDEFDVVPAVEAGYDGCLAGTGILNGLLLGRALAAVQAGKAADARQWQQRNNAFLRDLFREDISAWMSGLKYALRKIGLFASEYSHLSYPLTDEDRRRIDAALEREREFIPV